jgi:Ca2+-binding EF-hand superfamily protein
MNWLRVMVWVAGVGVVVFLHSYSLGQTNPTPMLQCEERFKDMDSNHDGLVSHEEFMAVSHGKGRNLEEVFKSRDINGDSFLTKEEFCAGQGMGKGKRKGRGRAY